MFDLDMTTRKSAYLFLGDGDDIAALNSFNAGRNFKIFAGAGNDTIASDSVSAGRRLEISLGAGDDSLVFAGTTSVRRTTEISGESGNDFVALNPDESESIDFGSRLELDAGDGDDEVSIGAGTTFTSSSSLSGGNGSDSISVDGTIVSDVSSFEIEEIPNIQSQLDAIFATLNNADIDATAFGGASQNSPLSITATSDPISFSEGDAPIAVDSELTISGPASISNASVSIEGFVNGQDVLAFENPTTLAVTFDDQTGVLSLAGTDSLETYQAALRAVTFENDSASPVTDQRTIQFSVTAGDETDTASRILNVVDVNSAPGIELSTAERSVALSELPVTIDDSIELSDPDDTELSQAIVQIATGFVANEDVLEFDIQAGINATFDPSTGTLTASGTADIADYQTFLQNVRFANSNATESSRTIRFSIGDGSDTASDEVVLQFANDV